MAHVQRYYINEILKEVCQRMGDITGAVFPDHRPSAKNEQMKEMVIISIPQELSDENAWQRGALRIELAVKDKTNGYADINRLNVLLDAAIRKFPIVTDRFSATRPRLLLKGADGLGFTVWLLQAKLIVNTTDSYV